MSLRDKVPMAKWVAMMERGIIKGSGLEECPICMEGKA